MSFPRLHCTFSDEQITVPLPDKVNIIIVSEKKAAYNIGKQWRSLITERISSQIFCLHVRLSSKVFFVAKRYKTFMESLDEEERLSTVVFYGDNAKKVTTFVRNPDVNYPVIYVVGKTGSIIEQLTGSKATPADSQMRVWDENMEDEKHVVGLLAEIRPQITGIECPKEKSPNSACRNEARAITIEYSEPGDHTKVDIAGSFSKWKWTPMDIVADSAGGVVYIKKFQLHDLDAETLFHFRVDGSEAISLNYRTKMNPRGMVNVL
ncbi:hypothetical protein GEMRC1_001183 [Eukaryota sp. GEM-RC1]